VAFDNDTAARTGVLHLIERGRRTIAIISGPPDNSASVERVVGWRAQLAEAGLEHGDDLVEYGDWGIAAGRDAAELLMARRPDVDAVFCANDLMAMGTIRYVHESGRVVPDDVAIVGFGDLAGETLEPPLTTVRADVALMGERMAELVLECISGCRNCREVLPTELVVRGTT
jgi:DNA-binding LacI/PurR family transcriptional regulator